MNAPRNTRTYSYYDLTVSICSTCLVKVEAKIVFRDGGVYMEKRCPEHGFERVLIADDVDYYRRAREQFVKPSEKPLRFSTPVRHGCPYDCGICPDHEQHSCLTVVEITERCNLRCPVCFAESGPEHGRHRSLAEVEQMLDAVVRCEGEPDVVQISGGEPTIHPDFFAILDAARQRPIQHLMVNTNGLRIAAEQDFAARLARYAPRFELYLQFDSLEADALRRLRGQDLRTVRERALARCEALDIPVTLVVTVARGINDHELGEILDLALGYRCVRGVTFQPVQEAGRREGYRSDTERLTLTEVRRRILEQSTLFEPEDILPVPCHPDAIAMGYGLRNGQQMVPLSGQVPLKSWLEGAGNTIRLESEPQIQRAVFDLFSTGHSGERTVGALRQLLCCLPQLEMPASLGYEHVFRVIIMEFADARNFDLRSIKKSCVHIAQPDGRLIPFETHNLLYRAGASGAEESRGEGARRRVLPVLSASRPS